MATTVTAEQVEKVITGALPQFGVDESQIIEDEFGVQLKGDDVGKIKTVGDAIDLVVSRAG